MDDKKIELTLISKNIIMKSMIRKSLRGLCAALAVIAAGLVVVSCGEKLPDAKAVAGKIQENATLNEADYTTIIDYCGDYAKKVQPLYDEINAETDSVSQKSTEATQKMATIFAEYPYLDIFRNAMYNADEASLGEANMNKVKELAKYEAFPLPEGVASELVPKDVVGDIEQMPTTDTTGVIADGDGEAVDMQVKD